MAGPMTWLVKFIEHRMVEMHVVRLIKKWLQVGVLEPGSLTQRDWVDCKAAAST